VRGPWTSGGFEYNYGIYGHAPHCSAPVDYTVINREDGSKSCVIGILNLFTRTYWCIDINLPEDKAYFTTKSFWHNSNPVEQPYYSWMNVGIKAEGNLQFIYPGTKWIQHNGQVYNWPVNEQNGKDVSFYKNNDFGGYKSYHVFGEHSEFFGGYWHNDDFGMGRYSTRDDKIGKKIWIWGLSQQGMLWEKLLTDNDGQYVELQSGRLFNQHWEESSLTQFKRKGFLPHATDKWTEYWFPVLKTKGFVAANNYGVLNLRKENGWLKICFSPLQEINDTLFITVNNKTIYSQGFLLKPLELYSDSIRFDSDKGQFRAILGDKKLEYNSQDEAKLNRPVTVPVDFDWNSTYGLYLQGKENIYQRDYRSAEAKLRTCIEKDPYYLPALVSLSMLQYNKMEYTEALYTVKIALSINTYDPAANYYYGLINSRLGETADAKDGFEIASMGMEYRSASWSMLSELYLKEMNLSRSIEYARKSIDFNHYNISSYQLLAVNYRLLKNKFEADKVLDSLLVHNPLNHFARFERYIWENSDINKRKLIDIVRNELPQETFLELAIWYYRVGRKGEAVELLKLASQNAEILYWLAFLTDQPLNYSEIAPDFVFPFRQETAEILEQLIHNNDSWLLKYHLALIHWNVNNTSKANHFFSQCGNEPDYAPFYSVRAEFSLRNNIKELNSLFDIKNAIKLDHVQWRYGRQLATYYLSLQKFEEALSVSEQYYTMFPENYYLGLLYVKALLKKQLFKKANEVLSKIKVLPNEGATEGRKLYKETQLMLALEEMRSENYKKAIKYIELAKQWPENLGVGKPYGSDIDERLEDWLAYKCYSKLGDNKASLQMLDKILSFKPQKSAYINTSSSANNLITAWVIEISENYDKAKNFLRQWLESDPKNEIIKWVLCNFNGQEYIISNETEGDENYRILKKYLSQ
jgi:predicted Zn-dependent protease